MKNIWNKIKTCWANFHSGFWPWVNKHEKCLYTLLATSLIALAIISYQTVSHSNDYRQWLKEKALLEQDLRIANEIITIQGEIIRKSEAIIREKDQMIIGQQTVIGQARQIIRSQDQVIKDLVDKLQNMIPPHKRSWAIYVYN